MRFQYIVYPEAQKLLDSSGLTEKIKQAHKEYKIQLSCHMLDSEVVGCIKEMKKNGFFEHIPKEERENFNKKTNEAWKNREKSSHWKIQRHEGEYKEDVDVSDFLLFTAWKASEILPREDLFNYKKFSFSSLSAFTGALSAAIENELRNDSYCSGLKWTTNRPDGKIYVNEITGDIHSDLIIYQTDITPYPILDPLESRVEYRPETRPDRRTVAAYHSTEGSLLTAVLKWINDTGIQTKSLENGAKETLEWARSLGQGGGTCTEHFGGYDQDARHFFVGFDHPLPQLDENNCTNERTSDRLGTTGDGSYSMYRNKENELVFSYENYQKLKPQKEISASFLPEEADHLIRGLLYQSARGLGRTSCKQLCDILSFRYSDRFEEFKKDMRNIRK